MVFVNESWNGTGEIVVYSNYHKYWLDRERRIKNGEMLAKNDRMDKVYFLQRKKSIDKLATGGARSYAVHMRSIEAVQDMDIAGDIVLLMDDVTTTGNSLYACKMILEQSGAGEVEMFALGKAI